MPNIPQAQKSFWTHLMVLLGDEAQVESHFGLFGDIVSVGARQVHGLRPLEPQAQKSFWTNPMVLLGDGGQVEARFSPFGDSVSISARQVHGLCGTRLGNHFGSTRWNSQVTRLKWNLVSVRLEIVFVLVQDRCTVCSKHGSEIILTAPDRTPR